MKERTKFKKLLLPKNLNLTEKNASYSIKEFVRQININNPKLKRIEAILHGNFQSMQAGSGLDFNEIREYKMGDDLRRISWNATAKTNSLQTKEYFGEKEIRSYFLVDISNSMFCGNKPECLIQLFVFLLNLSIGFSEKVGGVFFTSEIKFHFPPREATSQANIIFQTYLNFFNNLKDKLSTATTITNISGALDFTKRYFPKKGIVFLISDFINFTNWEKQMFETSHFQSIYSFQISDLLDIKLPKSGYVTIIDPETNEKCTVNTDSKIVQETYINTMNQNQTKLVAFLSSLGVNHIVIEKSDFA